MQYSQAVLIKTIHLNIVFVYLLLYVKTVLFQKIQFSVSTVSISKTLLFQAIQLNM